MRRALVVGVPKFKSGLESIFKDKLSSLVGADSSSAIQNQLKLGQWKGSLGDCRIMHGLSKEYDDIALVGLGIGEKEIETDLSPRSKSERSRYAAAVGIRSIDSLFKSSKLDIKFDSMLDAQATSEGAQLGYYKFDQWKTSAARKKNEITLSCADKMMEPLWKKGEIIGKSQNMAREWMESPSNFLTPTKFSDIAKDVFKSDNTSLFVRDREWAEKKKMNGLVAVAQGSNEKLRFLEVHYKGGIEGTKSAIDLAIVGKGVTFDSGGISLKPSNGMGSMKADMGGAAVTLATMHAIERLNLPINVSAFIPLCENMPSGRATRPGDIIYAMNGKSIEIDNTDAEGRLILADAIWYAISEHKPNRLIDIATLTGAMDVALGSAMAGVFTNSDELFQTMREASLDANEELWRMPLTDTYRKQIRSDVADLSNVGGRGAGSCTAAAFLESFLTPASSSAEEDTSISTKSSIDWAHIDMAGVMSSSSTEGYNVKGMSGRPLRALVYLCDSLSSPKLST